MRSSPAGGSAATRVQRVSTMRDLRTRLPKAEVAEVDPQLVGGLPRRRKIGRTHNASDPDVDCRKLLDRDLTHAAVSHVSTLWLPPTAQIADPPTTSSAPITLTAPRCSGT